MRTFSRPRTRQPLNVATARSYLVLNQFATPGLGSLLAGRIIAGLGQLAFALAGFVLVVGWFITLIMGVYNQVNDGGNAAAVPWLGEVGGGAFLLSWLWAWVTSLSLLREARARAPQGGEQAGPRAVPPRLDPRA